MPQSYDYYVKKKQIVWHLSVRDIPNLGEN